MKKYFTYIILFLLTCVGCHKELDLDLPQPDDKIVIDAWVEAGSRVFALVTANSPYFSALDSASIRNLVLTRAKVVISNGEKSEVMILRRNDNYFPPYIYESNDMYGEVGKTYELTVEYGGKTASAVTSITPKVKIDTAYSRLVAGKDSLAELFIEFTDPPLETNYYRVFTQRVGVDNKYYSALIMAIDGSLFDGKRFSFPVIRGPESYLSVQDHNYFVVGQTVNVKLSTMDKAQHEFWLSFQEEALNANNPFASSLTEIESNVEGDGLGVFAGYGSTVYQTVITED